MGIVYLLASLGGFACWIMTLIQMFKRAGALQGIIGIICGLWAFIWGWMNVGETGAKNIMLAWTVCILLQVIAGAMGGFPGMTE